MQYGKYAIFALGCFLHEKNPKPCRTYMKAKSTMTQEDTAGAVETTETTESNTSRIITQEMWKDGMSRIQHMFRGRGVELLAGYVEVIGKESCTIEIANLAAVRKRLKLMLSLSELMTALNLVWRNANLSMTLVRDGPRTGKAISYSLVYKLVAPSRTKAGKRQVNATYKEKKKRAALV
jgi:hypothetical protein